MRIPDGYVLIETPHGRDEARAVLAATESAGHPGHLVKAIPAGYLIPAGAEDHYVAPGTTPAEATYVDGSTPPAGEDGIPVVEEKTPDEGWKNADIEAYAADHGIDLDGATKKADMLAAIAAVSSE